MNKHGWQLIWTSLYTSKLRLIELFWQRGKQYVSFQYDTKQNMQQVWEQIHLGWYGGKDWKGQEEV